MVSLKGQTAVVTGTSSGIGRAIALELAKAGVELYLVGRNRARLEPVALAAQELGAEAVCQVLDLTDDAPVRGFAAALAGSFDILVHSAGVIALAPLSQAALADFDSQYRVNLRAPFLLTQALLPAIKEARGQIVFINSGAGLRANAGWGHYAATKHGLKALADSLREEVSPDGVRVLSVFPGRTASPMQEAVHRTEGRTYQPERLVQPVDVAEQVVAALRLPRRAGVTDLSIRPGTL
ncbi:MAG: SDR family oxidoreductase [Truepera sp.]|nr:SDR family oxidoreductase [Truepera sp.]